MNKTKMTLREALKACIDGEKCTVAGWIKGEYIYFDGMGFRFVFPMELK